MRVTAKATRSGDWWAVEVPEVPGVFTQARRLDQIAAMVADAVALMADVEVGDIDVQVDASTDYDALLDEVLEARREADLAATRAAELSRWASSLLTASGFTVRDAGQLLKVSPQRVSQLLNEDDQWTVTTFRSLFDRPAEKQVPVDKGRIAEWLTMRLYRPRDENLDAPSLTEGQSAAVEAYAKFAYRVLLTTLDGPDRDGAAHLDPAPPSAVPIASRKNPAKGRSAITGKFSATSKAAKR